MDANEKIWKGCCENWVLRKMGQRAPLEIEIKIHGVFLYDPFFFEAIVVAIKKILKIFFRKLTAEASWVDLLLNFMKNFFCQICSREWKELIFWNSIRRCHLMENKSESFFEKCEIKIVSGKGNRFMLFNLKIGYKRAMNFLRSCNSTLKNP